MNDISVEATIDDVIPNDMPAALMQRMGKKFNRIFRPNPIPEAISIKPARLLKVVNFIRNILHVKKGG